MNVKLGDPITILDKGDKGVLVLGEVTTIGENRRYFVVGALQTCDIDGENVEWLRGYRLPGSKEVNAARSAKALLPPSKNDFAGIGATGIGSTAGIMPPQLIGGLIGAAIGSAIGRHLGSPPKKGTP